MNLHRYAMLMEGAALPAYRDRSRPPKETRRARRGPLALMREETHMTPLTAFETPEADEDKHVAHIIEVMRRKLEKDYAAGSTKRDAHPKHIAVLQASFTVEAGLPAALQTGLFR